MSKEGFVFIPQYKEKPVVIKEDIAPYAIELKDCVVFEDDDYRVYQPTDPDQLIELSADTKWLAGNSWDHTRQNYNDINYNHRYLNPDILPKIYVIENKKARRSASGKYLFERGYGEFYAPSGANYAGATIVYNTNDEKLWKWFIDQNFQYITNNLQKKVGGKLIKDKTVLVYPTDFEGDTKMKLTWTSRIDSNITEIQIVPGTKKIKAHAFEGLRKVKSVVIPDSVISMGGSVFNGCNGLESVTLPNSLKEIPNYTFSGCCSLKTIKIPNSVTKIGEYAFYGYGYSASDGGWGMNSKLTEIEIPSSVKEIGSNAFYSCTNLQKVILHEGLEKIGYHAFAECISLKSINLPDSLKEIGAYAFAYTEMKQLFIPKGVEAVGQSIIQAKVNRAWNDNTHVKQPSPNQHILCGAESKPAAWSEDFAVYDINKGDGYYNRGTGRYEYPDKLQTYIDVVWGASRPRMNEDLTPAEFVRPQECLVYTDDRWDVYCPKNLNAFESVCDYIGVPFSEWFTEYLGKINDEIPDREESNRQMVDNMVQKSRFTIFNDKVEGHCYIYSDIRFMLSGNTIHTHYGYLFDETGLEYNTSGSSFVDKGGEFLQLLLYDKGTPGLITWATTRWRAGLSQLITKIKVDKILDDVNNTIVYGTDTYELIRKADWSASNPYYRIKSGVPLTGKVLYPDYNVVIPKGTKKIKPSAFEFWYNLSHIEIPRGVTVIGDRAFQGDNKIKTIEIPDTVEAIEELAFNGCEGLREVFIPNSVTKMGRAVFGHCDSVVVKCEAESQPADWNKDWDLVDRKWNSEARGQVDIKVKVEWGCKRN